MTTSPAYCVKVPVTHECIILDTSDIIKRLRDQIKQLEVFETNEDEIISLVFQSIAYIKHAQMELEYRCLDIAGQYAGTRYSDDFVKLAEVIAEFGKSIIQRLIQFKIYHNGYLYYQFDNKVDKDLMLRKLLAPDIRYIPNFMEEPD